MKPIIGILANTKTTSTVNEEIHLNCSYINAIEKGGGIPIIIPISTDEDNIKSTIEKLNFYEEKLNLYKKDKEIKNKIKSLENEEIKKIISEILN